MVTIYLLLITIICILLLFLGRKKSLFLKILIWILILPIIFFFVLLGYTRITREIDYNKNKKVLYQYIDEKYGKEFGFIQVEKEKWDFWTARTDTFYFRDKEENFIFEIAVENQEIFNDTYNENKLGKEVEKEFYKYLPKDINLDFIFKAECYGYEKDRKYSSTYSSLFVFYDNAVNYEEIYKLIKYIKNKFNGISMTLNISHVSYKQNYIKILNKEKDYGEVETNPLFAENITYEKIENLNELINYINKNNRVY